MGEEVLLSGCFAVPARLEASGFRFAYPRLDAALSHALRDG
jgi:NAD dependent epimerase/dehydratase family enzyme